MAVGDQGKSPHSKGNPGKVLSGKRGVLVITHKNCDMDAFASASIVAEALQGKIISPLGPSKQAKVAAEKLGIEILSEIPEGNFSATVVVDTSSASQIEPFTAEILPKPLVVLDHHSPKEGEGSLLDSSDAYFVHELPSSVEVVLNFFPNVTERTRKLAIAGIYSDSRHLALAGIKTLEKVCELSLGDESFLEEGRALSQGRPEFSQRFAVIKSLPKVKFERIGSDQETILARTFCGSFESVVAGTLISAGADISLAASAKEGEIRIAARSSHKMKETVNLGELFQKLGGGGHPGAALVNFPISGRKKPEDFEVEAALERTARLIKDFLGS